MPGAVLSPHNQYGSFDIILARPDR